VRTDPAESRYRLLEQLPDTPFFSRCVAQDRVLRRRALLSFLRDAHVDVTTEVARRFVVEGRRARELVHPHILRTRHVGTHGQIPFVSEDLPPGKPLSLRLEDRTLAAGLSGLEVGVHATEALAYAHSGGVIHGALSGAEVYVGDAGEVRLGGLGTVGTMARLGLAQRELVRYRWSYSTPEERQGSSASARTDVYSLGVILCEVVLGRRLDAPSENRDGVREALLQVSSRPDIGPQLAAVLSRALAREPSERYATAQELLADLRGIRVRSRAAVVAPARRVEAEPAAETEPEASAPEMTRLRFAGLLVWSSVRGLLGLALTVLMFVTIVGGVFLYAASRGPSEAVVPDVVGKPQVLAEKALTEAGLKPVLLERVPDKRVPAGSVVKMDPYPHKIVKEGREVELVISTGPPLVKVPDVAKLSLKEAQQKLVQRGLKAGKVTEEPSRKQKAGRVIRQVPSAGTSVRRGKTVDLVVSTGPPSEREAGPAEFRYGLVSIVVPEGEISQRVRVAVVQAGKREQTVYDRVHRPGNRIEVPVGGEGDFRVRVYLDEKLQKELRPDW